ncbi:MAG TPA: rod shape-determining protein MreC [Acidimicrobiales bacterium]|nr:rod shape-determining protein MreC [Acidimicrobiales bacterium]
MAKPRRSRRTLTTLVVLLLISVTVITLDATGKGHTLTSGIKSVATSVFSPFRSGVNDIIDPIGDFFAGAVHYGSLEEENHKLQAEIGALRMQAAMTPAQQKQLAKLEKLLALHGLPAAVQRLPHVAAQTVSRYSSNFAATITIDKGRGQGVVVGDPVVAAGGLVGKVVVTSHSSATVQLVTDGQFKVGVVYGTNQFATLVGQGPGKPLAVDYVNPTTHITKTDLLVTNGLAAAQYPQNIPVAIPTSIRTVAGATQKDIQARPLADLGTLAYVYVLQWSPTPTPQTQAT